MFKINLYDNVCEQVHVKPEVYELMQEIFDDHNIDASEGDTINFLDYSESMSREYIEEIVKTRVELALSTKTMIQPSSQKLEELFNNFQTVAFNMPVPTIDECNKSIKKLLRRLRILYIKLFYEKWYQARMKQSIYERSIDTTTIIGVAMSKLVNVMRKIDQFNEEQFSEEYEWD